MKIGLDIDGVLAKFDQPFARLLTELTGKPCDVVDPDCWEWPRKYGFSDAEESAAWTWISAHPEWWGSLPAYADAKAPYDFHSGEDHEFFFITARTGKKGVRRITEEWLQEKLGIRFPCTLLTKEKGLVCHALGIDVFVDDKPVNCTQIKFFSPKTRVYLRQRPHNHASEDLLTRLGIHLTPSVETCLNHEFTRLRRATPLSPAIRG